MRFPHLPDWTIYAAVIGALLIVSLGRREKADAPHAPEDEEAHGALLGPVTPFDPSVTVIAPDVPFQPSSGTAFSNAPAIGARTSSRVRAWALDMVRWHSLVTTHRVRWDTPSCPAPSLSTSGRRADPTPHPTCLRLETARQVNVVATIATGGPP